MYGAPGTTYIQPEGGSVAYGPPVATYAQQTVGSYTPAPTMVYGNAPAAPTMTVGYGAPVEPVAPQYNFASGPSATMVAPAPSFVQMPSASMAMAANPIASFAGMPADMDYALPS